MLVSRWLMVTIGSLLAILAGGWYFWFSFISAWDSNGAPSAVAKWVGISAAITLFISQSPLPSSPIIAGDSSKVLPDGEEAGGAAQYELQRLRDPATGKIPANIRRLELEYAATLPGYIAPPSLSLMKGSDIQVLPNGESRWLSGLGGASVLSSLNWQSRGPWNVGGRTRAFAIDDSIPNKFLAGSTSDGMWSSANGGTSWTQNWTAVHQSVSCIAQDIRWCSLGHDFTAHVSRTRT